MKHILIVALSTLMLATNTLWAGPDEDKDSLQRYFNERFPARPLEDFANGALAFETVTPAEQKIPDATPPLQTQLDEGRKLFETPFANGKTYGNCFRNAGYNIASDYPYFDVVSAQVKTLETEINECRKKNGEAPLPYDQAALAKISAFMYSTSRGNRINVIVPDDTRAVEAFNNGKRFFFSRRGQQNMSCAHCHLDNMGKKLRTTTLAPILGLTARAPLLRAKWDGLGILHRSFAECTTRAGAKPFALQGEEYRNLEFYLNYVSNSLPLQGPSIAK